MSDSRDSQKSAVYQSSRSGGNTPRERDEDEAEQKPSAKSREGGIRLPPERTWRLSGSALLNDQPTPERGNIKMKDLTPSRRKKSRGSPMTFSLCGDTLNRRS